MEFVFDVAGAVYSKLVYYLSGTYTLKVIRAFWDLFSQLWIFLVLGILLTSLISVFWSRESLPSRFFTTLSSSRAVIPLVALAGVVSPMPVYVVIPFMAALVEVGIPISILVTFLVSSPLMNPMLFLLTAGALGYPMAIARTVCAILLGMTAGYATAYLIARNKMSVLFRENAVQPMGGSSACGMAPQRKMSLFLNEMYRFSKFIGKFFFMGISIAAVVQVLIPVQWIMAVLGDSPNASILIAVAAGIPLYACGGGTIPVMKVLMGMGLSKGAILAFFISGPATKLSTLVTLRAAMVKEIFYLYLLIALTGATVFGFLYNWL